jgi:hypothetical protein
MIWFSLLGRENRETRLCGYGLHIYFEVIEREEDVTRTQIIVHKIC